MKTDTADALKEVLWGMGRFALDALPYVMTDDMLKALLNAGGPYPTPEMLEKMAKEDSLGSIGWFLLAMEKVKKGNQCEEMPGEILLFLMDLYCSLVASESKESAQKEVTDKLAVYACHEVATRWPKLGCMCSALSSSIIHRSEPMRRALAVCTRRSGERLMLSAAVMGSIFLLSDRFKRLPGIKKELSYLLNEVDEPQKMRNLRAVAWACIRMKKQVFLNKGGLEKVLDALKDNQEASTQFLQEYFLQTTEAVGVT